MRRITTVMGAPVLRFTVVETMLGAGREVSLSEQSCRGREGKVLKTAMDTSTAIARGR